MWITDPTTKLKSVSLTLLMITFSISIVAGIANMLGKIENTSIITEMLYSFVALYFGRRMSFKGKNVELSGKTLDEKVD